MEANLAALLADPRIPKSTTATDVEKYLEIFGDDVESAIEVFITSEDFGEVLRREPAESGKGMTANTSQCSVNDLVTRSELWRSDNKDGGMITPLSYYSMMVWT